ncbi:polysaccharide pyruvyl transferase CsaB [Deinococcus radiophilus]|uniref:Polysaccharide pyruvyl transferase CsaB n=1 Tax=Deinococcus radiophilus TaxID=32062 RepID=A0A3S0KMR5_9DEIO|nr:polysaccharide pyruvyl transferase CsaB [Deinococcus radiophilus]RTR30300.1 polysaccharide pyruvyl transferase CsaB [Deinococcus radiophilus]UFA49903.1 polysaccharide pyruvyl transferase CsaB [Deinococcus radiophilus]
MSLRVLVSGYYGFANGGDEAIALSISRELRAWGHTPVLLSADPAHTAAHCECEAAPRMNPLALARELRLADLLLSGGGGLLQDKTSARNLTYYLGLIRLARLLGTPAAVFNQSIGPLSVRGGTRVRRGVQGLPLVVRDRASLRTLETLGLQGQLGGDPALLLTPSPALIRDETSVVIAPRGDVAESLLPLRDLVSRLQAAGHRVTALALMPAADGEAARSLGADTVLESADPQLLLDAIAASGYVVGVRLHALILAAAAGVPFAGLSYDPKVQGFCSDAGAPVHSTAPDVGLLLEQVQQGVGFDSRAVEEMKARARASFDVVLGAAG